MVLGLKSAMPIRDARGEKREEKGGGGGGGERARQVNRLGHTSSVMHTCCTINTRKPLTHPLLLRHAFIYLLPDCYFFVCLFVLLVFFDNAQCCVS